uniref:Uncharacterized protein n=1 Tax=Timema bartmani TaxID=61472 RepID=A0A7R9F8D6_9NEOP|nr:unnamed protein product [Timema bartmani]
MAVEYPEETAALLVPTVTAVELPEETETPLEHTVTAADLPEEITAPLEHTITAADLPEEITAPLEPTVTDATKEAVLHQIGEAECVHLATHVSWKLSAIVLSPGNMVDSQQPKRFFSSSSDQGHDPTDEESSETWGVAQQAVIKGLYEEGTQDVVTQVFIQGSDLTPWLIRLHNCTLNRKPHLRACARMH